MKSIEEKEHFIRLRAQGLSFDKIEERLGISKKTLITSERKLSEDVQKERAKEIEDIREAYWVEKRARIELLLERQQRLREEERRRDFSDVPTAKLTGLELQTSEQLKKEMRDLSIQFGYRAFGSELTAKTTGTAKCETPTGRTDKGAASDTFVPFSHNDAYTLSRAFLDKQPLLMDELFKICTDAESESTRIAAIKAIDTIYRRMIELIQSLGLATTITDERQIGALVEWSSVMDRRAIIAELVRYDVGFSHLPYEIHSAERAGDTEEVDKLYAEFDRRVRELQRKKMREEVLQLKTTLLTETDAQA